MECKFRCPRNQEISPEANHFRFLLAQLYLDSLVGKRSLAALRTALQSMRKGSMASPDGSRALDNAYEKAMERIQRQKGDLPRDAMLILSWVVYARKQLTVPQLQEALGVEIGKSTLDKDNIPSIGHITKACDPLIVIDKEMNVVRLVHYTAQEYFKKSKLRWLKDAEVDITKICITYLSFETFDSGFCQSDHEWIKRVGENELYRYAAGNWGHHAREALSQGMEATELLDFLQSKEKQEAAGQEVMTLGTDIHLYNGPRQVTAVHIAAYFGLYEAMLLLLKRGHPINARDILGRTPLFLAAGSGQTPVVDLLLHQKDVQPDMGCNAGQTPLWRAAVNGHEEVVKLLLEKNVYIEVKDLVRVTPLAAAAWCGHTRIVKLLLEAGAHPDSRYELDSQIPSHWLGCNEYSEENYVFAMVVMAQTHNVPQTPLACASKNNHERVVRLLLAGKANPNTKDLFGMAPLTWATLNGHNEVVSLLLASKADPEAKDNFGLTALAWATKSGFETIASLLLSHRAGVDAQSNDGTSILHLAAHRGDEAMVSLLLQHDADIETRNAVGATALAAAIEKGSKTIVKLLLKREASVNYLYHLYQTREKPFGLKTYNLDEPGLEVTRRQVSPLWRAAEREDGAIVGLLLDKAAELNFMENGSIQVPLLWAARTGQMMVLKMLIERGDDVAIKDDSGTGALSMAAKRGHAEIVSFLLTFNEVDADERNNRGRTPLSYAAQYRRSALVKLFTELEKVDGDSKDNLGRTPLSYAVGSTEDDEFGDWGEWDRRSKNKRERTDRKAAIFLLSCGKVNPNAKDNEGRTPLSYASTGVFAKALLSFEGVDIELKDNVGRTALSHAAEDGCKDVVKVLLEHGADRNSTDDSGQTPLMWARKCPEPFQSALYQSARAYYGWDLDESSGVLEQLS